MFYSKLLKLFAILLINSLAPILSQESEYIKVLGLKDAFVRHARFRCLQLYPKGDFVNYSDNPETHCLMHCFLYRMGLMNLETRGPDPEQLSDQSCSDKVDFQQNLSGTCRDLYLKLMEFREKCFENFEITISLNSNRKVKNPQPSKKIGQSATEFCDYFVDNNLFVDKEESDPGKPIPLKPYKMKLQCIFENFHYLDAYGRVDETEINLSYQEALEDTAQSRSDIHFCSHRANSMYKQNFLDDLVVELQNCLRDRSLAYEKVYKLRDQHSRQY